MEEKPTLVEPTTPPPAPEVRKSRISKWPYFVIGLLLLLVLALGGYLLLGRGSNNTKEELKPTPTITSEATSTPTPSEVEDATADWKTYTNMGSKYSVKYPSDTYVRLICPDEELVLRTRGASDTKDEETFETCGRGGRFTIEVVTADSFTEPTTDEYIEVTKKDITVAGVAARDYVSTKKAGAEGPIPDYSNDIYFELGGKKHLIHFDQGVSEEIRTNLLESFKLI